MGCISSKELKGERRYERIKHLDSGTYGSVELARDLCSFEEVAIKYIPRKGVDKHVESEILNFSKTRHPQVIQFREVFLTPQHLAICMEYADGGNLHSYLNNYGPLKEDEARWLFQQVIMGLNYCHSLGIKHRDLKLENTLLCRRGKKPLVKICDFGVSKNDFHSITRTKVGTPGYTAPEVLQGGNYSGQKADVWSAGVMLYIMLFAQHPFLDKKDNLCHGSLFPLTTQRILMGKYSIPRAPKVSKAAADLLRRIFVCDPTQRIMLKGILRHPWFCKNLPSRALEQKHGVAVQAMQSEQELMLLIKAAKNS